MQGHILALAKLILLDRTRMTEDGCEGRTDGGQGGRTPYGGQGGRTTRRTDDGRRTRRTDRRSDSALGSSARPCPASPVVRWLAPRKCLRVLAGLWEASAGGTYSRSPQTTARGRVRGSMAILQPAPHNSLNRLKKKCKTRKTAQDIKFNRVVSPRFSGLYAGFECFRCQIRILRQLLSICSISEVYSLRLGQNIRNLKFCPDVFSKRIRGLRKCRKSRGKSLKHIGDISEAVHTIVGTLSGAGGGGGSHNPPSKKLSFEHVFTLHNKNNILCVFNNSLFPPIHVLTTI